MCIGCVAYNNSTRVRQSVSLTCAICLLPAAVSAAVFELLHLGRRGSYLVTCMAYGWLCGDGGAGGATLRCATGTVRDNHIGVKCNSV